MDILGKLTPVSHRTLLSSTFVPFFVLLSSAIWTVNTTELEALGSLLGSLEARQDQSTFSASRLLKTFKPLYTAACQYVELKSRATPTDNAVSFEEVYQETAPTTVPIHWQNLSALTTLDHFMFQPYTSTVIGNTPGVADGAAPTNGYDTSSSQANPGLAIDSGQVGESIANPPGDATSMQASQLGEWFVQSRYMMDLLEDHGE